MGIGERQKLGRGVSEDGVRLKKTAVEVALAGCTRLPTIGVDRFQSGRLLETENQSRRIDFVTLGTSLLRECLVRPHEGVLSLQNLLEKSFYI